MTTELPPNGESSRKAALYCNRANRPVASPVNPDSVPDELKQLNHWVVWSFEWSEHRDKSKAKWSKVLKNARTGRNASSTNSSTWATLEVALDRYRRGGYDGIGFVFADDDPFAGVDLDGCRHPETGELATWALEIVSSFGTYTEVSPSGTGVKLYCRARLPAGRNRRGPVEIYDRARYFATTGIRLDGTPATLSDCQAQIESLQRRITEWRNQKPQAPRRHGSNGSFTDEQLIAKAKAARNGVKFSALWAGDTSAHGGDDSAADLALCNMLAFWCDRDAERIDRLFRQSGLYREKWEREDYKQRTIQAAIEATIGSYHVGHNGFRSATTAMSQARVFRNFDEVERGEGEERIVDRLGIPMQTITRTLLSLTNGWPKRVDDMLFVPGEDGSPLWLSSVDALFAFIARQLGNENGVNPIHWGKGVDKCTQGQLFAFLQQTAESYRAVECFPHYPQLPEHCYMHVEPQPSSGQALNTLLSRFEPSTLIDRDLILSFFLTLVWGGAPGQRPAFLVTTEDDGDKKKGRGSGKTTLAKIGARLMGGLIQASAKQEMHRLVTRLLSPTARGKRVVLLDNIKSLKFSWGELEALITSDVISGHAMYEGEGQRPNTLTWCLTINGASLSRDMAQRCVVTKVKRPDYSATWEDETNSFIEENRWAIVGDCLEILRAPGTKLAKYSRWGAWEAGVLARVGDPAECQRVIRERQEEVDDDASEAAIVREAFTSELSQRGHNWVTEAVWIPATVAAEVLNSVSAEKHAVNRAGVYLGTLSIPELRKSDREGMRGWAWRGEKSEVSAPLKCLKE
ncbi:MAG: hypothetical protein L0215_00665 [Gemmataceae bacterium]|nr:hypothetical protein [Gemmataceae bacterium]